LESRLVEHINTPIDIMSKPYTINSYT